MKVKDVQIGYTFEHGKHGNGIVIAKTKRTITVQFENVKIKATYKDVDTLFSPGDF